MSHTKDPFITLPLVLVVNEPNPDFDQKKAEAAAKNGKLYDVQPERVKDSKVVNMEIRTRFIAGFNSAVSENLPTVKSNVYFDVACQLPQMMSAMTPDELSAEIRAAERR